MQIKLHANARTTPKTRTLIKNSKQSVSELARQYGISENTVRKWKTREHQHDHSHIRHNLGQSTNLTEESLIVEQKSAYPLTT